MGEIIENVPGVACRQWRHIIELAQTGCLLHASILVDYVGPPSAEVCRTAANFPQVDDLRFIELREVEVEDGLSQATLQSNKRNLLCPQHT